MKTFNKLLMASCILIGSVLSAIPGSAQTPWAPYSPAKPSQAVVGSTAQRQAAYNSFTADQRRTINDKVRPYVQNAIVQALVKRQANLNTQDLKVHSRILDGVMQHDLSRALSLQGPLMIASGGGASSSAVPLYPTATTAFAANTASGQITGADLDHDGLPDAFENQLADAFTPFYHVSAGEPDNFATFFDSVPETVNQRLGPNPFSYFRVKPLGFAVSNTGVTYGFIQINYLTLWDHDSGLHVSGTCDALIGLAGGVLGVDLINLVGVLSGHNLDDEHSAALVAAPVVNGGFNLDPTQYFAFDYFTAAHEGTFFDHSAFLNPGTPVPANLHIQYGLSLNKHSTYGFNPDGLPMFPDEVIFAYYATILDLLNLGIIDDLTYEYLLFVGDTVFFNCVVEHFSEQGGGFASGRVNVGEPVAGSTLNGAGFILDPNHALPKLTETLWTVTTPPIIVTVTPAAAGVNSGQTLQFQASVVNAPNNNQGVTWSISPQAGSISQTGLYSAPNVNGQQTVTVTACSTSNSSRCGTALVFLNPLAKACLSTASLTFGNQITGTTSAAQSVTLTSCGSADLLISGITTSGNFAQSNNCPSSLAVNASCTMNVTFTPSGTGTLTGTLTVSDIAVNSPQTVSLTGTGAVPPDFSLSIDAPQTVDPSVNNYVFFNYSVGFNSGLSGSVSVSVGNNGGPDVRSIGSVYVGPVTFSSSGSGTITIILSTGATPGDYYIFLTGTGAGITHSVFTILTIPDNTPPSSSNGGY
jgi:hypothetical protein